VGESHIGVVDRDGVKDGTTMVRTIAAYLTELPAEDLRQPGHGLEAELGARQRPAALSELAAVAPLLLAVGRHPAAEAALVAINDVGAWWP
jgi:hypothetical protein